MMSVCGRGVIKVAQEASRTALIDSARATGAGLIVMGGGYLYDRLNSANRYGFFDSCPTKTESKQNAHENARNFEFGARAYR